MHGYSLSQHSYQFMKQISLGVSINAIYYARSITQAETKCSKYCPLNLLKTFK
jgi:hypothetical protein